MNRSLPGDDTGRERDRGTALLMAVFVLVLLTGMGTALLFLGQHETRAGRAGLRAKRAFYLSEAAIENGRTTLFATNGEGTFSDDLAAAAGANGVVDFDPAGVQAIYDDEGRVTGFTGFGDDVPLRAVTTLGSPADAGWFAAFLTNDPVEGVTSLADANERVMITGIGAGDERSFEVSQAIVEKFRFVPEVPAAALTLLGPNPSFDNGTSAAQNHDGSDCGIPGGPFAPIVGTVDSAANLAVQDSMERPEAFASGPWSGEGTIGNLTNPTDPIVSDAGHGTIDPLWLECLELKKMVDLLRLAADYYCNEDVTSCTFPAGAPDQVVFIDGDMANTPAGNHSGILVITGELVYHGNTGWDGVILAIGEGRIVRTGGGTGNPSGAVVVASIDPTPDGPSPDRSDWCTSPPDGFGNAYYDASGGGASTVEWCTSAINGSNSIRAYRVAEFLQR
jgi:hypothetical protein